VLKYGFVWGCLSRSKELRVERVRDRRSVNAVPQWSNTYKH
jgi:hypothetical protein